MPTICMSGPCPRLQSGKSAPSPRSARASHAHDEHSPSLGGFLTACVFCEVIVAGVASSYGWCGQSRKRGPLRGGFVS